MQYAGYDTVTGIWNGAVEFFSAIGNGISAAFTWAADAIGGIWSGVVEFFSDVGFGISDSIGGIWQPVQDMAAFAWEGIAAIWNGAVEFFGGIVGSISGVFSGLFDWLREKFDWVFNTIDAIGSIVSKVTGAVTGAWNTAFGDGSKKDSPAPAATGEKASRNAEAANTKSGAQAAQTASQRRPPKPGPGFKPGAAPAAQEAARKGGGGRKRASGGGSRAGAGGGGGGSRAAGDGAGRESGPVTVVTLDSGKPQTVFMAANSQAGPAQNASHASLGSGFIAGAASALKSGVGSLIGEGVQMAKAAFTGTQPASGAGKALQAAGSGQQALPKTPGLIARSGRQKREQAQQNGISIDLTQNFDLITEDAQAARKVLEAIRPDMEALIRRALEKINSNRTRTAYAQ